MDQTISHSTEGGASRSAFVKRYVDLYRAAKLMTGLGNTVKIVGIVLASIIFLFWFIVGVVAASGGSSQSDPFAAASQSAFGVVGFFMCLVIGIAFGALVGGLFFLLGVLISAQGQLLMAGADSAVCASPFLTDEERATAMSLPYTAPLAATAAG